MLSAGDDPLVISARAAHGCRRAEELSVGWHAGHCQAAASGRGAARIAFAGPEMNGLEAGLAEVLTCPPDGLIFNENVSYT